MARPSVLARANTASHGNVHRQLRRWRARGVPAATMRDRLVAMGIAVDESTVRRYLRKL